MWDEYDSCDYAVDSDINGRPISYYLFFLLFLISFAN